MKKLKLYSVATKERVREILSVLQSIPWDEVSSEHLQASPTEARKDQLLIAISDSEALLAGLGARVPQTRVDCAREIDALMHDPGPSGSFHVDPTAQVAKILKLSRDPVYHALWAFYHFKTADELRSGGCSPEAVQSTAIGARALAQACVAAIAHEASSEGLRKSDSRHQKNRERKADGLTIWRSKHWRVDADGIRAIQRHCNVTYKTAERWVLQWKKEGAC